MPQLRPSWQLSVTTAVVLAVVALVCATVLRGRRGTATLGAFCREFTLVMSMLGLWQYIGGYVHTRFLGAMERGRAIHELERLVYLPSEAWVQSLVLPHDGLVRFLNDYYAYVHLNATAVCVVWMWWRHREAYPRLRTIVVASTLACFLIQIVPVAPPRLLTDLGYVDTAIRYGQSVYGDYASGTANQLSAMPSVHIDWALIVAVFVWRYAPRALRWVGPAHLAMTFLVVVATANHWWMDGVVAAGLVAAAAGLHGALERATELTRTRLAGKPVENALSA
jgi:hypothetical protein